MALSFRLAATNHLSWLTEHFARTAGPDGRPDGQTSSRDERKSGDERGPLTGKPKAREAVKNRVVFGSGCLFCSPRPFGFRHLGLPFRRSRGFPIRKKNYDKMDLV